MKKGQLQERNIIVNCRHKRPYGARIQFLVQTLGAIGELENVTILLDSGKYIVLRPREKASWENFQGLELNLVGFATATSAEAAGKKLVQALLWTAIQNRSPLQLKYRSYEPVYVFERNPPSGFGISLSAEAESIVPPLKIIDSLHDNYLNLPEPETNLLLSMEIFAGAKLETSDRARYLAMVSALEPMAKSEPLDKPVNIFVNKILTELKTTEGISQSVRNSLAGRIGHLRNESIRQALKRLIKEFIPEINYAPEVIDEAYAIRSEIVHNGQPRDLDIDLSEKSQELENILTAIYEKKMELNI